MRRGYITFAVFSILSIAIIASTFQFHSSHANARLSDAYSNERLFYSLSSLKRAAADSAGDVSHMEKEILATVAATEGEETTQSVARKLVLVTWAQLIAAWNSDANLAASATIGCGPSRELSTLALCGDYIILAPPQSKDHAIGEIQTFYIGAPQYGKVWLSVTDKLSGKTAYGELPDNLVLGMRG